MILDKIFRGQRSLMCLRAHGIDRDGSDRCITLYHFFDPDNRRLQAIGLYDMRQTARRILRKNRMKPTFNKSQAHDH